MYKVKTIKTLKAVHMTHIQTSICWHKSWVVNSKFTRDFHPKYVKFTTAFIEVVTKHKYFM